MKNVLVSIMKTMLCLLIFGLIINVVDANEPTGNYKYETEFVERYFAPPVQTKSLKQIQCLAQAIYYEAGNQDALGKEAVALVIVNRVNDRRYPRTICGVVRQSHLIQERRICQFSFWCEVVKSPKREIWSESLEIARRVLKNHWKHEILVRLNSAMYFHADYVNPQWRKEKQFLGKIGNHLFYAEKPGTCTNINIGGICYGKG